MSFWDAIATIFTTHVYLIVLGVVTALGLLRGLWKGIFKKAKTGSDYMINLIIYICTEAFLSFLLGCALCLLLIYLPGLLGISLPFLEPAPPQ